MGSTMYIAASGAEARLRQLELVANNLANANTDGYKADRTAFESFFEGALSEEPGGNTSGTAGGVYVSTSEVGFDHAPGPIRRSGGSLDVAIEGPGFFVVETDQGERYSRAGSFTVNGEGQLVTSRGNPVLGTGGPIDISSSGARIIGNGDVVENNIVVGSLRIVDFAEKNGLAKQGGGLFEARPGYEAEDVDQVALIEGSVETSNVKPTAEMATLVILQRAFEASIQAMQRDDQATESLIREISQ